MRVKGVTCFLALLLTACGGATPSRAARTSSGQIPADALSGEMTVFAASSLTAVLEDVAAAFEAIHRDTDVTFNFAGSQQLAGQIVDGAPADVFAPASPRHMQVVADAGLVAAAPRVFASNLLQVAVEPGNPLGIRRLADLARPDVKVVLAAEEVPAGQYARQALKAAGVHVQPVSLETEVKGVLSKVALGEADAGIVYVTDVIAAGGDVEGVSIPEEFNVAARYPIAVLRTAPNRTGAEAFVGFIMSPRGQAILGEQGFGQP
ncbi:MAG: molybdate ABC transporter substrate-binding protein [Actinomycetota bacterium]|nr:molybdate ABC transporter substrate-binding protein [Actinomycetota bacterium]